MYRLKEEITPEYILKRVSEKDIFLRYSGFSNIDMNKAYLSPLRTDTKPTCSFFFHQITGRLYFKDFRGDFVGDCFEFANVALGNIGFTRTLQRISNDFKLDELTYKDIQELSFIPRVSSKIKGLGHAEKEMKFITESRRPWKKCDKDYWHGKYGITRKILEKFKVIPVYLALYDNNPMYGFSENSPGYVYDFGNRKKQIYVPKGMGKVKFILNSSPLMGYMQLPDTGEHLVITKSFKDVIVLYKYGVTAVSFSGESSIPDPAIIKELKRRFKKIISLYDFDYAGIRGANNLKRKYGISPFFFTNGRFGSMNYKAKDFSDYREIYGHDNTQKMVLNFRLTYG